MNTMGLGLAALVEDSGGGSALAAVGAALFGAATLGVARLYWLDEDGSAMDLRDCNSVANAIEWAQNSSWIFRGGGGAAPFIVDEDTGEQWALVEDRLDAVRGAESLENHPKHPADKLPPLAPDSLYWDPLQEDIKHFMSLNRSARTVRF
jgi:hypothetical protein